MATGLPDALLALTSRMLDLATRDSLLRDDIRAFAEALLTATDTEYSSDDEKAWLEEDDAGDYESDLEHADRHETTSERFSGQPPDSNRPLGELTLGQNRPRDHEPHFDSLAAEWDEDSALLDVVTRCLMKAEGSRWAAIRLRKIHQGVDFRAEVAPRDREVIEKAGSIPGCFLWTNTASFRPPENLNLMETLAECFEVMAEAVTLVLTVLNTNPRVRRNLLARSLEILAEAQSALRVIILRVGGSSDSDQFKVYQWIRQIANAEGHFIHRYMKLEDPADPERAHWTRGEIASIMSGFQQEGQRDRQRESRLKTLRFHANRLGKTDGDEYHWHKVMQTIDEAVNLDNFPPSSVELRDILIPILEMIPDVEDSPLGFSLVLREVDRYLASQTPQANSTNSGTFARESDEIREVARLLGGRAVLMIGGHRQPHAQAALASAFELKELIWFDAKEHGSNEFFRPSIARDDVALVLLAIRWSSHSFGDVKIDCDRLNKPLVRLPAGYNPQQVAVQILSQCSGQLRQLSQD